MTAVTPSRSGVSPSSSPRLPSPPPFPKYNSVPKAPALTCQKSSHWMLPRDQTKELRGGYDQERKLQIWPWVPPLVPLSQLDSAFQLQEHLKSLYSHLTQTPESTHTIPITKETALQLATPPQINDTESVDRNLWLYELCRFLTQKANVVSIFLMNDNPPCSAATCPEMRASEWQYLCAVHEPPKSCCAIDYCNHTLDWAANVLTSPKHFPSRLALGGEAGNVIQSMRQLTNIFRRVYRIFAHAWFQHRDVFWSVEATYGLYMLFKVVCDEYHLIPEDSYTIPPEAEGGREAVSEQESEVRPQILRKDDNSNTESEESASESTSSDLSDSAAATTVSTGATTRRHKHTPSTGSHVATIAEGAEEEEEQPTSTIATKPTLQPGVPQLVDLSDPTENFVEEKRGLSPQPKKRDNDPSPNRTLPKLDIASSVPKYEPRPPEDPTPTGNSEDVDPLSVHRVLPAPDNTDKATPFPTKFHPETPIEQVTRPFDDNAGEKVTSPSGGSIRTAGNDVLAAIMGHIDDGNEDDSPPYRERSESLSLKREDAKKEEEKGKSDDGDDAEEVDVDDDGNEAFSPVAAGAPSSAHGEDELESQEQEAETKDIPEEDRLAKDDAMVSGEESTEDESGLSTKQADKDEMERQKASA